MKTIYLALALLITTVTFAQVPQGFNYQATVRNSSGELLVDQNVYFKFNLMLNSQTSVPVFTETHYVPTDDVGQVNLVIGQGTTDTGNFSGIDWGAGNYFLGIELNTGNGYVAMGTTQLLSVPYALYAENAGNTGSATLNLEQVLAENNSANDQQIKDLADPTDAQDAVTKNYTYSKAEVDAIVADLQSQIDDINTPQYPEGTVHCDPNDITEVVDVTNPTTGKTWMDRNLGASQVANSSTDTAAYGDLYQWGRGADGHQCRDSGTTSTLSSTDQPGHGDFITISSSPYDWRSSQNDNLWQGVNGLNNPCPSGYRLPTEAELDAERESWSSNNSAGAFASPLKLPVAGDRDYSNAAVGNVGLTATTGAVRLAVPIRAASTSSAAMPS